MEHGINFWRLVNPELIKAPSIEGVHNHWLCLVAVLIAIMAAGVLLPVTNRYHRSSQGHRLLWLFGGSLAMGTGIWAMHFTAMLAYRLPLTVSYSVFVTVISIIPAVMASAYCIVTDRPAQLLDWRLHRAALCMALGIGLMHYLGMEAMVLAADMYYAPAWFVLSIVAAYLLALIGLYIHSATNSGEGLARQLGLGVGSVVLGLAVSGMHFIAMRATYFVASEKSALSQLAIEPYGLIVAIVLVAVFLIALTITGVVVDGRMSRMSVSLHESEMRFSQLAENTQMAIFTFDATRVIYANPALCKVLGLTGRQVLDSTLTKLFGEAFQHLARDVLTPPLVFDKSFHEEFKVETHDGELKWIYFSLTLTQFRDQTLGLASGFDISYQKHAEYSLRELAYQDHLTGLANRTMFIDRLDHHLKLLARARDELDSCVMLLDLDGFKSVNDRLGHQAGDDLLCAVGDRLRQTARDSDTVARLGGDEFVMLFEHLGAPTDWSTVADRLVALFSEAVPVTGGEVEVGASIGVLPLRPAEYDSPDDVLRDVDIALYRAKHYKKSHWVMFDDDLDAIARRHRTLQGELKEAVQNNRLQLFYQPIVDVPAGSLHGFEALSRWQRDNGEWVSPAEFIPLAERSGLISDISIWALREASRQLNEWKRVAAGKSLYISVNVAAILFGDERFFRELGTVIEEFAIAHGEIKLELTESMLMKEADSMLAYLDQLSVMGFELMLDDFGTGYSSLAALNHLPISTVKIDRSFVDGLSVRDQAASVIKTIISLANQLDMAVISEGVETAEQAHQLVGLGCPLMQGYYFGKPLPPAEASNFIDRQFSVVSSS